MTWKKVVCRNTVITKILKDEGTNILHIKFNSYFTYDTLNFYVL